jgi:hypothetical protein
MSGSMDEMVSVRYMVDDVQAAMDLYTRDFGWRQLGRGESGGENGTGVVDSVGIPPDELGQCARRPARRQGGCRVPCGRSRWSPRSGPRRAAAGLDGNRMAPAWPSSVSLVLSNCGCDLVGGTRFELVASSVSGRSASCLDLPRNAPESTSPGRILPHGAWECLQDCGEWLPLWLPLRRFGSPAAAPSKPGSRRHHRCPVICHHLPSYLPGGGSVPPQAWQGFAVADGCGRRSFGCRAPHNRHGRHRARADGTRIAPRCAAEIEVGVRCLGSRGQPGRAARVWRVAPRG